MIAQTKQKLCLAAGFISLGLGIIGVFLPVMPTAPFIIAAAFFFSKGSKKWHQWLLNHPHFGEGLRDWDSHGVIRKKHKYISTFMIFVSAISISIFAPLLWVKVATYILLTVVLCFIWSRPSEPRSRISEE